MLAQWRISRRWGSDGWLARRHREASETNLSYNRNAPDKVRNEANIQHDWDLLLLQNTNNRADKRARMKNNK